MYSISSQMVISLSLGLFSNKPGALSHFLALNVILSIPMQPENALAEIELIDSGIVNSVMSEQP